MPGVYPFPEWEDVVYGYLDSLYRKSGRPVTAAAMASAMEREVPGSTSRYDVEDALDSLEDRYLVKRIGKGYITLRRGEALERQLEMEEVEPFTREYGEVPEAHVDKVWDFRTALTKPSAGGKWGLAPTSHYFYKDKPWTGLTQEEG